jgi:hypothetical protein
MTTVDLLHLVREVLAYAAALLAFCLAGSAVTTGRLQLVLMLYPIALDCLGNWLIARESLRFTMSAAAWKHRDHKYTGWCYRAIDGMFFFQENHCRIQAEREDKHGSVWASWLADWKAVKAAGLGRT